MTVYTLVNIFFFSLFSLYKIQKYTTSRFFHGYFFVFYSLKFNRKRLRRYHNSWSFFSLLSVEKASVIFYTKPFFVFRLIAFYYSFFPKNTHNFIVRYIKLYQAVYQSIPKYTKIYRTYL